MDLALILRGSCASLLSLSSEAPALNRPPSRLSALEEAMELYQIGRFLELDILAQGCEDIILEGLTLDSLPSVLRYVGFGQSRGSRGYFLLFVDAFFFFFKSLQVQHANSQRVSRCTIIRV